MTKRRRRSTRFSRIKRRWHRADKRIPILPMIPIVIKAGIEPVQQFYDFSRDGDYLQGAKAALDALVSNFTGYNPHTLHAGMPGGWELHKPLITYGTILLGYAGSKLCTKVGVNKAMRRIPIIGSYIKL